MKGDIVKASIKIMNVARYLNMAAADELNARQHSPWLHTAVEQLTEVANDLGYVLIPTRQTGAASVMEDASKTEAA